MKQIPFTLIATSLILTCAAALHAAEAPAAPVASAIALKGSSAGRTFEGLGALSAGASICEMEVFDAPASAARIPSKK
jgi:hypothetical protein